MFLIKINDLIKDIIKSKIAKLPRQLLHLSSGVAGAASWFNFNFFSVLKNKNLIWSD